MQLQNDNVEVSLINGFPFNNKAINETLTNYNHIITTLVSSNVITFTKIVQVGLVLTQAIIIRFFLII